MRQPRGIKLGHVPTLGQAVRWVADLGDYFGPSNGPPGPTVIGRGLHDVLTAAQALQNLQKMRSVLSACRPHQERLELRAVKPIGVLVHESGWEFERSAVEIECRLGEKLWVADDIVQFPIREIPAS